MTTADLQERIAHATFEERYPDYPWESAPEYVKEAHRKRYAPAMPIIAAEVRAAFAEFAQEALEEGTKALSEGRQTEFTIMQVVAEMAQKRATEKE